MQVTTLSIFKQPKNDEFCEFTCVHSSGILNASSFIFGSKWTKNSSLSSTSMTSLKKACKPLKSHFCAYLVLYDLIASYGEWKQIVKLF